MQAKQERANDDDDKAQDESQGYSTQDTGCTFAGTNLFAFFRMRVCRRRKAWLIFYIAWHGKLLFLTVTNRYRLRWFQRHRGAAGRCPPPLTMDGFDNGRFMLAGEVREHATTPEVPDEN